MFKIDYYIINKNLWIYICYCTMIHKYSKNVLLVLSLLILN